VLLGLSLGGMVAAAWASAHPDEVAGCVLVNTSMRPFSSPQDRLRPRNWLSLLRLLMPMSPRRAEEAILALTSSAPLRHAQVVAEWVAIRQARPVAATNALRQLWAAACYRHPGPVPRVPVLVLASAGDALVDPRCSADMARRWQVGFELHPQAGHDLPLDDGAWLALRLARWAGQEPTD
jgi:pimeloyl-ACP methyl ester carboxylesterase